MFLNSSHSVSRHLGKSSTSSLGGGMPSKLKPLMAFEGQAFTHSSHVPHLLFKGVSGVRGIFVMTEACLNLGPVSGFTIRRLFPNHPSPAALATALLGRVEEVRGPQSNSFAVFVSSFSAMLAASEAGTGMASYPALIISRARSNVIRSSRVFAILWTWA